MNGIEFLQELRKDEDLKSISVFMMTTSNDDQDKLEAYNFNVAGYVIKPLSFEKFVAAVSILNNYWQLCARPDNIFEAFTVNKNQNGNGTWKNPF